MRRDGEKVSAKADAVFCEIPPDRIDQANREYKETGKISEPRVKVFPEYVDVLYPLTKEMEFELFPCAGWTKPMADAPWLRAVGDDSFVAAKTHENERKKLLDELKRSINALVG